MEGSSSRKPVASPAAADLMDVEPSKLPSPASNMSLLPVANGGGSSGGSRTKPNPTGFTFAAVNQQDSEGSAKKSHAPTMGRSPIIKIRSRAPPPQRQQEQILEGLHIDKINGGAPSHRRAGAAGSACGGSAAGACPEDEAAATAVSGPGNAPTAAARPRGGGESQNTALTVAEKGKAVAMPKASLGLKNKQRTTETDNGAVQALAALSALRKLELPKLRFELTKEEIEKDFMMTTSGKPPYPKKHPKTVEKKIELITPEAYLPDVNMGRYTVRIRKSRKDKQRKAGLKGMMDDERSNDSN